MALMDTWFFTTFVCSHDLIFGRLGIWNHILPWSCVITYYLMITYLPKYLGKDHKGYRDEIKWFAVFWNLGLSILSGLMLVGTAVPYWEQVKIDGWWRAVCDADRTLMDNGSIPSLFWGYAFAASKFLELFDTLILILKQPNRELLFLHWYHHITVLLFTWYGEYYYLSLGYQFLMANTFVHLVMYFYYFLTELGVRPGVPFQIGITSLQILQMVYGVWMSAMWCLMYADGWGCSCESPHIIITAGAFMYISYFCLFFKMFLDRYVWGKKKNTSTPSSSGRKVKKDQ